MVREGEAYQEKTMAFKHDQSKGRWCAPTCVAPYCLNVFCTVDLKCNVRCTIVAAPILHRNVYTYIC